MSRISTNSFLANTLANLVVGAAALGYAVLVPAVVIRRFGTTQYGIWYLAFQVAGYVLLLDLGSQFIVTNEAAMRSPDSRSARLATAAMILQSALAMGVLIAATTWAGVTRQSTLSQLIVILGASAVASLLASTVKAWFIGLRRAHVPAVWLVSARVSSFAGLGLALATRSTLIELTVAVAAPQLAVHAWLLLWARRPPSPWALPDRTAFAALYRTNLPLVFWTICGVIIGGLDLFVVRAIDPLEVGRYALALPLIAIPAGIVTAAITAWMPRVASATVATTDEGVAMTVTGIGVMVAALSLGAIPFLGFADELVHLMAGPGQWDSVTRYVRILYVASSLRFVLLPWIVLIVVKEKQAKLTLTPAIEAVVNVVASVLLGVWIGATGVALGTLFGALVALLVNLIWGVRLTSIQGVTPKVLALAAIRAWAPLACGMGASMFGVMHGPVTWRCLSALLALTFGGIWLLGGWRQRSTHLEEIKSSSPQNE